MTTPAFIGLGSNLGEREENLRLAVSGIEEFPDPLLAPLRGDFFCARFFELFLFGLTRGDFFEAFFLELLLFCFLRGFFLFGSG